MGVLAGFILRTEEGGVSRSLEIGEEVPGRKADQWNQTFKDQNREEVGKVV